MSEFSLFFNLLLVISVIAFSFFYHISSRQTKANNQSILYFSLYFLFNAFGFAQFLLGEMHLLTASGNTFFVLSTYALVQGLKCRGATMEHLYRQPVAIINTLGVFVFTWWTLHMAYDMRVFRVALISVNIGTVYFYGAYIAYKEQNKPLNANVVSVSLLCCSILMAFSWLPLHLTGDATFHLRAIFTVITLSIFLVFGSLLTTLLADVVNYYYQNSITDTLSNLYNRRHLMEAGQKLLSSSIQKAYPVSCVMCDIDNFKTINDEYGHDAGDKVIAAVAELFYQETRSRDLAARVGGEEFAILLNDTDSHAASDFANRLRERISLLNFTEIAANFRVTASFGVVCAANDSLSALLKSADTALYQAKDNGRNCVVVAQQLN